MHAAGSLNRQQHYTPEYEKMSYFRHDSTDQLRADNIVFVATSELSAQNHGIHVTKTEFDWSTSCFRSRNSNASSSKTG